MGAHFRLEHQHHCGQTDSFFVAKQQEGKTLKVSSLAHVYLHVCSLPVCETSRHIRTERGEARATGQKQVSFPTSYTVVHGHMCVVVVSLTCFLHHICYDRLLGSKRYCHLETKWVALKKDCQHVQSSGGGC